jgi:hypothetical protein
MAAVQENAEPPSGSPVSGLKYSAKPARSTSAKLLGGFGEPAVQLKDVLAREGGFIPVEKLCG